MLSQPHCGVKLLPPVATRSGLRHILRISPAGFRGQRDVSHRKMGEHPVDAGWARAAQRTTDDGCLAKEAARQTPELPSGDVVAAHVRRLPLHQWVANVVSMGKKADGREKPPTIYDVAEVAGVAPSTVSRALARPGRVSAQTADKVRRAAELLGYGRRAPSVNAGAFPTRLLAIIVADIANPVFHDVVRGAEAAAEDAGYTVILFDAQESDERERRAAEQFLTAVDGLVLASPRLSDAGVRSIAKQRPLVTLNRQVRGLPSVLTDSARGTRRAAEHLGALGHRSLTYVAGPESSWADGMRWRGVQEAGLELDMGTRRIASGVPTVTGGEMAAKIWSDAPTSGVICYNDIMAIGFIRGVQAQGLDVPGDVSVVGFDNSRTGTLTSPALTSVASPLRQQGELAVSNLIAIINGARSSEEPLLLPTRLMVRNSTGEAPAPKRHLKSASVRARRQPAPSAPDDRLDRR